MSSRRKSRKQLEQIKGLVAAGEFHFSAKVQRLLGEGTFGIEDIERCIATAKRIHKREVDELNVAEDGWKYTILGEDTYDYPFYTCGKITADHTGKRLYFFITAHENET